MAGTVRISQRTSSAFSHTGDVPTPFGTSSCPSPPNISYKQAVSFVIGPLLEKLRVYHTNTQAIQGDPQGENLRDLLANFDFSENTNLKKITFERPSHMAVSSLLSTIVSPHIRTVNFNFASDRRPKYRWTAITATAESLERVLISQNLRSLTKVHFKILNHLGVEGMEGAYAVAFPELHIEGGHGNRSLIDL